MTSNPESMRIAVTGASGLIGSHLRRLLEAEGHEIIPVGRWETGTTPGIRWDPSRGEIDSSRFEGLDAVVHLAGENIGNSRWTQAKKERILRSRVDGTSLIAKTIAALNTPPAVLISASAVGYYGDRGDREVSEEDGPGSGFLADACVRWEAACAPARDAGIRVVNIRTGVVISAHGGALPRMLVPFRLGIGGRIGSGMQYLSWIHLPDLLRAIRALIIDQRISGAVNVTSPNPVTNSRLAAAIGQVVHRPAIFPVPAFLIRAVFGQMGEETLLWGVRAMPSKLVNMGFEWEAPDIGTALKRELGGD